MELWWSREMIRPFSPMCLPTQIFCFHSALLSYCFLQSCDSPPSACRHAALAVAWSHFCDISGTLPADLFHLVITLWVRSSSCLHLCWVSSSVCGVFRLLLSEQAILSRFINRSFQANERGCGGEEERNCTEVTLEADPNAPQNDSFAGRATEGHLEKGWLSTERGKGFTSWLCHSFSSNLGKVVPPLSSPWAESSSYFPHSKCTVMAVGQEWSIPVHLLADQ